MHEFINILCKTRQNTHNCTSTTLLETQEMRRKSTRTSGKLSPEKGKQTDSPARKSRRSSKRRRKSSDSENSDEEQDAKQMVANVEMESTALEVNSDTENKLTMVEKDSDVHEEVAVEKQGKKIKLQRNRSSGTNDEDNISVEDKQSTRRSRRRGSPKAEERTPQEDDDDDDDKKGKGKSKGKTKSKIEKSQPLNESESHNESEISTNAQVTPQSPQIDNTCLVDNVVDVAGNAEDNRIEIEPEEKNEDTETDEQEVATNEIINKAIETETDCDQVNEATSKSSDQKDELCADINHRHSIESNINTTENRQDHLSSNEPDSIKQTSTDEPIAPQLSENTVSEEKSKSEEDFAGFIVEQTNQTNQEEFAEEPMDISTDITFTAKTADSSLNVMEPEDTNENVSIQECKDTTVLEKKKNKPYSNQKIVLIRDASLKPPMNRKKGWGFLMIGVDLFTITVIDSKIIENIYTNVQFLDESEVKLDVNIKDRRRSFTEGRERTRLERSISANDTEYRKNDLKNEDKEQEDNANIIAMNRKISIVDDSASKLKPPPSPAKNPLSNVLFITNLVRPFTLKQLKELLERTGTIKENGFWTDRIKSKCYVQYQNVEDAEATRNALHGVHWPIGNGKKLMIDYSTEDDLENARNPPCTPPIPEPVKIEKENVEPLKKLKEPEEEKSKEKEKVKEKRRHEHIREWDVGKTETYRGRSRSREREKPDKRRRSRHSPSPYEDYISRKQKKADEQVPQKLMDDLFQKTKTTPSIYWQPLSPEEISTKQQQRLERMAEHKRRLEESTRTRAEFGRGGPYRRRYD